MATTIIKRYSTDTTPVRPLYRATQIVWYLLGILEVFLAFRFLLKLVAANPAAGFTNFVYAISDIFVAPFNAVLRTSRASGSIFEWSTLLAMAVYWLLAWAIIRLIVMGRPVSRTEAHAHLQDQDV